jgi:Tol biopolymer transport system component/aminoglycoside phosphotransferase (APT) family kinase protein
LRRRNRLQVEQRRMTLAPGTRFGSFEITGLAGAGGMGEVYRASDPTLGREVALKVLPEAQRVDPQALARFEREARLLASLNHPNIATLHGLATSGSTQALVMELVEGETLKERIARTSRGRGLGLHDALEIATQIAAALDAAHEDRVVHRDLKPSNIKVRADGTVKVLDFGIAKALAKDSSGHSGETVTHMPGAIVGTPSYMSPEQASGAEVDRRTDIWAFGCVLYEMLTGQRAFDGDTDSRTFARIIEREPDWSLLPADVPTRIRTLLMQCLEKDPRKRRRDAGDLRLELERLKSEPQLEAAAPAERSARRAPWWLAGAATLVALAAIGAAYLRPPAHEAPAPEMRLQIVTPPTLAPEQFALSPDGRYLVFAASESPKSTTQRLYLRSLDSTEAHPIAGTEGARLPFWSPDSRSIGFYAPTERLSRVDIDGGRPQPLALAPSGLGAAWSPNGTILFSPDTLTPLFSVPASGGETKEVTHLVPEHQRNHRVPSFLPDGRQFLFYAQGDPATSGVYLGSLDGTEPKRILATDKPAVFIAPDQVVYVQDGALVARRFDAARAELTGPLRTLASPSGDGKLGIAGFSASTNGVIAYRTAGESQGLMTTWFDASGKVLRAGPDLNGPALSPDERFIAYDLTTANNRDVWILDLARGGVTRFTTDPAVDGYPMWSPDGQYLIFESDRNGTFDLWIAPVSRVGEERLFLGTDSQEIPIGWSTTGYVLYRRSDANYQSSDLLAVSASDPDRKPIVIAGTPFEERMGSFSPDGKWVAYDTDRSGRSEVVVQAFPEPNDEFPISTDGGLAPLWSTDGSEIYFVAPDGAMMSARVKTQGSTFAAEKPVALFAARVGLQTFNQQYDVTRDRRFVVDSYQIDENPPPITVLLNWKP